METKNKVEDIEGKVGEVGKMEGISNGATVMLVPLIKMTRQMGNKV